MFYDDIRILPNVMATKKLQWTLFYLDCSFCWNNHGLYIVADSNNLWFYQNWANPDSFTALEGTHDLHFWELCYLIHKKYSQTAARFGFKVAMLNRMSFKLAWQSLHQYTCDENNVCICKWQVGSVTNVWATCTAMYAMQHPRSLPSVLLL